MEAKALFSICFLGHSFWECHSFFFFLISRLSCLEFCPLWILIKRFYVSIN